MSSYAIAYWSMPASAAREFFDTIIRQLARRFDGPLFEPHLTLFVAPEGCRAPREVLGEIPSPDLMLAARLKQRRVATFDASAEFEIPAVANKILAAIMRVELQLIKGGVSLPAGGSLLLVGRR